MPSHTKGAPVKYSPSAVSSPVGGFQASGALSGVSGATWLSGPWFEETQSLTIDYVRVPRGHQTDQHVLLNDCSSTQIIFQTSLVVRVEASYQVEKTYTFHDSSAYQQPQTFVVAAASADGQGVTYGVVSAGLTLGCAGTINTAQPWKNRRYWLSADDEVILSGTTAYNYAVGEWRPYSARAITQFNAEGSSAFGHGEYNFKAAEQHFGNYDRFFIPPGHPGTATGYIVIPGGYTNTYAHDMSNLITKMGPYDTTQDEQQDIVNLINNISNRLSGSNLYPNHADQDQIYESAYLPDEQKIGLSEYSSNRHIY